jgi:hypothetical protein
MVDTVAPWLASIRADLGVEEIPGPQVNPRIIAKARLPGVKFPTVPGLVLYGLAYKDDDRQAWCGAEAGGSVAEVGLMPPFNAANDLESYFWAASWRAWGVRCKVRVGAIACLDGHVAFVNAIIDANTIELIGGNQLSPKGGAVTRSVRKISAVLDFRWPDDAALAAAGLSQWSLSALEGGAAPALERPLLRLGSTGGFVTELQTLLGLSPSGTFDQVTELAVRAYQASHGLTIDGEVWDETWPVLLGDKKASSPPAATAALPAAVVGSIVALASSHALARYDWRDRGRAPAGYIKGMAVAYGVVCAKLKAGNSAAQLMAQASIGDEEHDALSRYEATFARLGMSNAASGADTLRHLFVLLIGLGMRESSGRYCEGRDTTADNTSADTAEAGLFQQSWNSHVASAELPRVFALYSAGGADGMLAIFREGVTPRPGNLVNFGTGDGATFQALCKSAPAFAVEAAAVCLRVRCRHFGPIDRREAEVRPEADELLRQVQAIIDSFPGEKPPMTDPSNPSAPSPGPAQVPQVLDPDPMQGIVRAAIAGAAQGAMQYVHDHPTALGSVVLAFMQRLTTPPAAPGAPGAPAADTKPAPAPTSSGLGKVLGKGLELLGGVPGLGVWGGLVTIAGQLIAAKAGVAELPLTADQTMPAFLATLTGGGSLVGGLAAMLKNLAKPQAPAAT